MSISSNQKENVIQTMEKIHKKSSRNTVMQHLADYCVVIALVIGLDRWGVGGHLFFFETIAGALPFN